MSDGKVHAVDGVDLDIDDREIRGLLGESGCGKSTLTESIVRSLSDNAVVESGQILVNGENILEVSEERLREIRWETVAFIPQNAMGSLDPVSRIGDQIIESIQAHRDHSDKEARKRAEEVLDIVNISPQRLNDYPHQLSGGMRQRVVFAMSLVLEPDLIIADEPTTGLDVLTRDRILNDLERYRDEFGISVLFVSHDIADLVETCDTLSVMYGGKIVERGPSRQLFSEPSHPYTMGLRGSLPSIHGDPKELIRMDMNPPDLRSIKDECRFIDKCPFATEECETAHPPLEAVRDGIEAACYRAGEASVLRDQASSSEVTWVYE
ncbi:oligopeptide/dipeptide ABC transporter ATP-binding protein [Halobellus sp. GM3]|uniref:oligopeptide/dipeptide ABC transporter ATP-binding protein n=1 Tax=Halobellus sp. GM3 TaxID=3458410 RepID=UPI00403E2EC1